MSVYVDEAESGRVADRPQFRRMLDAATGQDAPFEEILVWKFSRFTRKREHAVAFKSMLRRRGVKVTSITEHADDSPTGKLMVVIPEIAGGACGRLSAAPSTQLSVHGSRRRPAPAVPLIHPGFCTGSTRPGVLGVSLSLRHSYWLPRPPRSPR